MKYGQFLEETLTPEWRRVRPLCLRINSSWLAQRAVQQADPSSSLSQAYINYKALKKLIKSVKGQQSRFARPNDSSDDEGSVDGDGRAPPTDDEEESDFGIHEHDSPKQQYQDQQAIERLGGLVRSGAPTPRGSPRPPLNDQEEEEEVRGTTEDSHTSSAASSLGRTTQLVPPSEEIKGYGSLERSPALGPALKGSSSRKEAGSSTKRRVRLDDGAASGPNASSSPAALGREQRISSSTASPRLDTSDGGVVHRLTPSSFLPPGSVPLPPSPAASATPRPGLDPAPASGIPSLRLSSSPNPLRPQDSPQAKPPSSPWSLLPSPKLEPSDAGLLNPPWKRRSRKGSIASPILGDLSSGPPRTGVLALLSDPAASCTSCCELMLHLAPRLTALRPPSAKNSTKAPAHLEEVLPSLQPAELRFVEALDVELAKVEKYVPRLLRPGVQYRRPHFLQILLRARGRDAAQG